MTLYHRTCTFFLVALSSLMASSASAAGAKDTVGDKIFYALGDMVGPLFIIISSGAFIAGLYLVAKGLMKFKQASDGHSQGGHGQAGLTVVAGAMMIMLPEVAGIGMSSIMGAGTGGIFGHNDLATAQRVLDTGSGMSAAQSLTQSVTGLVGGVGSVENCIQGKGVAAVTCMAKNIANNVVPVGIVAVFAFVFLAGLMQFASCIHAMTTNEFNGDSRTGWWMKLLTAVLMMNGPFILMSVSSSMFGNNMNTVGPRGLNSGSSLLNYDFSSFGGSGGQYAAMMGHIFTILVLFGVIAFVRGLFIMKNAAESRGGNGTIGHGLVFVVAGVLLANSKYTTCIILNTIGGGFGGSGSFGFC